MARAWRWLVVFLVAVAVYAVATMPARVVLSEETLNVAGEPITLSQVSGRLLSGALAWRWRHMQGTLRWKLGVRALVPTVKVHVQGEALQARGYVSALPWRGVQVKQLEVEADVGAFSEALALSVGGADGTLQGHLDQLRITSDKAVELEGVVNYSGGRIHWTQGSATVGPLVLQAQSPSPLASHLTLQTPSASEVYMEGKLEGRSFEWRVYRRWVQLLGMSQGGSASDTVFTLSDQW